MRAKITVRGRTLQNTAPIIGSHCLHCKYPKLRTRDRQANRPIKVIVNPSTIVPKMEKILNLENYSLKFASVISHSEQTVIFVSEQYN